MPAIAKLGKDWSWCSIKGPMWMFLLFEPPLLPPRIRISRKLKLALFDKRSRQLTPMPNLLDFLHQSPQDSLSSLLESEEGLFRVRSVLANALEIHTWIKYCPGPEGACRVTSKGIAWRFNLIIPFFGNVGFRCVLDGGVSLILEGGREYFYFSEYLFKVN